MKHFYAFIGIHVPAYDV